VVFAVNTFDRFNTAAVAEVDIYIDSNGDGNPDFMVFSYDRGALTTGSYDGTAITGVLNLATGRIVARFLTAAPTDGSTLLLQVRSSDIGLSPSNPRFSYQVNSINWNGDFNAVPGVAKFNAFTSAISQGDFVTVAPGASASSAAQIDPVEWALTPSLGVMVVDMESRSGAAQATLLKAR
jgi:hypothetical protein